MPQREEQAGGHRLLAFLHELAGDVVDGGDVVGVNRVTQAEAVGQQARAEQHGMIVENDERCRPGGRIGGDQEGADGDDLAPQVCTVVVEQPQKSAQHNTSTFAGPLVKPGQYDVVNQNIIQRSDHQEDFSYQ